MANFKIDEKTHTYTPDVCPYDAGLLLIAHEVLKWAVEQDVRLHLSLYTQTVIDAIDNVIMNEAVRQVRIKRLEEYTTSELEQELKLRKK